MLQCHSPKSSHSLPLPQSPKDCSLYLCLFCCLAYRVIVTIFLNSIYMHQYTVLVFFFLAYFTVYNRLQFHPSHQNWFKCILFNGWVILHCNLQDMFLSKVRSIICYHLLQNQENVYLWQCMHNLTLEEYTRNSEYHQR